ncbi:hypothetical protein KIH39_15230 [Telmatocola sphagniphila]|uniref:Uncharacterized protein n=1 Tax=Telmatocola sphagniphila TaxID=1123043 RepID=A0A8E6ETK2_9BACT|nr:hypothetical protein [Telmatocola sphagniphila]QVL30205.1 hypothetical protein KIH39_15230 [Telmatocola sphagniphila]
MITDYLNGTFFVYRDGQGFSEKGTLLSKLLICPKHTNINNHDVVFGSEKSEERFVVVSKKFIPSRDPLVPGYFKCEIENIRTYARRLAREARRQIQPPVRQTVNDLGSDVLTPANRTLTTPEIKTIDALQAAIEALKIDPSEKAFIWKRISEQSEHFLNAFHTALSS